MDINAYCSQNQRYTSCSVYPTIFLPIRCNLNFYFFLSLLLSPSFSTVFVADVILVQRYLHSVHGNVDKAKKLIEHSFTMRNNYPHIFLKRDPNTIESLNIFETT